MKKFTLTILLFMLVCAAFAQTQIQNSGWLTLVNNTKFGNRWGVSLDAQVRSADNWDYVRNVLIRPGVVYYLNGANNISVGYLYATTHTKLIGADNNLLEQRVWEQFIHTHKLKSAFVTHRLRLEQRFIETNTDAIFAQRFRYFVRLLQPLQAYKETFDKGLFVALQEEVFLNIQHKELLNKSLFDQNRLYFAVGYRVSKKLDLEAGYLNQYIHGATTNTSNRVAQLAIYTRF